MPDDIRVIDHPLDRVVQIANGKGGVGKTSLAANLAVEAAKDGLEVLLIDMDPQGNLAEDLGYGPAGWDDDGANLAEALISGGALEPNTSGRPGLDVVCGGTELRRAERHLVISTAVTHDGAVDAEHNNGAAYRALAYPLAQVAERYDLVLLDSPPGFECLLQSALGAARWLVVPAREDDSSLKGLSRIGQDFEAAVRAAARIDFLAVVLFGTPSTATAKRAQAKERLRELVPEHTALCDAVVRASTSAAAARYLGLAVSELSDAVTALPPWHEGLRRKGGGGAKKKADPSPIPLPDTAALAELGQEEVLRVLRSTGGNLAHLAADYDALAEEIFTLINVREDAAAKQHAEAGV
jgi:cellulose biosynthesis protein BcsQ